MSHEHFPHTQTQIPETQRNSSKNNLTACTKDTNPSTSNSANLVQIHLASQKVPQGYIHRAFSNPISNCEKSWNIWWTFIDTFFWLFLWKLQLQAEIQMQLYTIVTWYQGTLVQDQTSTHSHSHQGSPSRASYWMLPATQIYRIDGHHHGPGACFSQKETRYRG